MRICHRRAKDLAISRAPKTDADEQCEFRYQPEGWEKAYRFIALRYAKDEEHEQADEVQYQLFETRPYKYRVFVTNLQDPISLVVWFYNQRAGAENLIKEANNDAGLAAHPSGRFDVNRNHFQLAMLAYNLNAWLMLLNRAPQSEVNALKHTTLATSRLRFLFIAAKIWRHAGRTGVSYSDHYEEKTTFQRLMTRLRHIASRPSGLPLNRCVASTQCRKRFHCRRSSHLRGMLDREASPWPLEFDS